MGMPNHLRSVIDYTRSGSALAAEKGAGAEKALVLRIVVLGRRLSQATQQSLVLHIVALGRRLSKATQLARQEFLHVLLCDDYSAAEGSLGCLRPEVSLRPGEPGLGRPRGGRAVTRDLRRLS